MGARGGAIQVRAWKCPSCEELFQKSGGGRKAAVRCCNDAMAEAERKQEAASAARAFAKVPSPRVTIKRESWAPSYSSRREHHSYAVAKVKCPRCRTDRDISVQIEITPSRKRLKAVQMARTLCRARIARHLHSRYGCY